MTVVFTATGTPATIPCRPVSNPSAHLPPALKRFETWLWTGPAGHLAGGALDFAERARALPTRARHAAGAIRCDPAAARGALTVATPSLRRPCERTAARRHAARPAPGRWRSRSGARPRAESETRPCSASGRESITSRSASLVGDRRDARSERRGECLGGLPRAALGVADGDDPLDARPRHPRRGRRARSRSPSCRLRAAARRSCRSRCGLSRCASPSRRRSPAAPSRSASAARPSGVERSVTTCLAAAGSPSSSAPRSSSCQCLVLGDVLARAVGLGQRGERRRARPRRRRRRRAGRGRPRRPR